jgi:nitrogenase molybdenum-iron protein alpha/beta subunit
MTIISRVEPLLGCRLAGILKAAAGIERVVPIVHGPMGCASGHRIIPLFAGKEPLVATTALTEMDIIMGAEDRLRDAVRKAQSTYKPDLIIVILTCATSLTSAIMSAMTSVLSREIGCPIFIVDGSGIVGDEIDGYCDFYRQYREYEEKLPLSKTEKGLEAVGISAADYNIAQDIQAIQAVVREAFHVTIERWLFHDFSLPKFCGSYQSLKLGRLWLEEPIPCPAPIGAQGVAAWADHVGTILQREVDPGFTAKMRGAASEIARQKGILSKLRVGIEAESWWAVGLARFLSEELGCSVLLSSDIGALQYQEKFGSVATTLVDVGNIELIQYFKEFKVDIVFGSSYSKDHEWAWIPLWQPMWHAIDTQESLMGLEGVSRLLSVLNSLEAWRNDRKNVHFK